jgi:hypothetical protein
MKNIMARNSRKLLQKAVIAMGILFLMVSIIPAVSAQGEVSWPAGWLYPIPGQPITAPYGANNSGVGGEKSHSGIDIGTGSNPGAPVQAMNDGIVTLVENYGVSLQGQTVCVFHGWDTNGDPVTTVYGHTKNPLVAVSQVVARGQVITYAHGFQPPNGVRFQPHIHVMYEANQKCAYNRNIMRDPMKLPQIAIWWDGRPNDGSPMPDAYQVTQIAPAPQASVTIDTDFSQLDTVVALEESEIVTESVTRRAINPIGVIAIVLSLISLAGWFTVSGRNGEIHRVGYTALAVIFFILGIRFLTHQVTESVPIVSPPPIPPQYVYYVVEPGPEAEAAAKTLTVAPIPQTPAQQLSPACSSHLSQWYGLMVVNADDIIPANVICAVMRYEDPTGNPNARSYCDAVGLMQVMPGDNTAKENACGFYDPKHTRPTIAQLEDPAFNVQFGTNMLRNATLGLMDKGYPYEKALWLAFQGYFGSGTTYPNTVMNCVRLLANNQTCPNYPNP